VALVRLAGIEPTTLGFGDFAFDSDSRNFVDMPELKDLHKSLNWQDFL
jgi:hypothetical protein